jgi:hypothetical protein
LLTGTFLLSVVFCPLLGFSLYLLPFYKAPGAYYRGDYFMIGVGAGLVVAFAFSFVWMAYLPGLIARRAQRQIEREAEEREQKREDEKKAREAKADAAAKRQKDEEE